MARPYPWETIYPPGIDWGTPIATSTLTALLDRAADRFGPAPALRFRAARLSYAELRQRVDRLAAGLIAEGLRPGDRVGLLMTNSPYHPIAFFAVLRAGGVVVHLTPLDPPRALARKLADSGAIWVISQDVAGVRATAERLLESGACTRLFLGRDAAWDDAGPAGLPDAEPPAQWPVLRQDDVAVLQYTGGTTGVPKAAMLSHTNLTAAVSIGTVWTTGLGQQLNPSDRMIGVLPLFHIYALTSVLLRGLAGGAEILLFARFDAEAVVAAIERDRATTFHGVPTMWTALANLPGIDGRDLSSLRIAFSGGAPMPMEIVNRLAALTGHRLGGGWGMTETSPVGTVLPPGRSYGQGEIGVPQPGIVMRVVGLDDPTRVLPPGQTGEIAIQGPNVTRGYWNRPEENAQAFVDGFFLTGDVGHMTEDGRFFLIDRKKDMILSGGFNVYPRMIEDAIYEHPDVAEAAVVGVPDAYRGQSAKAFVVLRPGAAMLTLEALKAFLAERIGRHEIPTALEIRETLPKTPVGKLSRRALLEPTP
jgi:long-chain acyl-CoA synthetase